MAETPPALLKGAGMVVGFKPGGFSKPYEWDSPTFGYDYIHGERGYDTSRPIRCTTTFVNRFYGVKEGGGYHEIRVRTKKSQSNAYK